MGKAYHDLRKTLRRTREGPLEVLLWLRGHGVRWRVKVRMDLAEWVLWTSSEEAEGVERSPEETLGPITLPGRRATGPPCGPWLCS